MSGFFRNCTECQDSIDRAKERTGDPEAFMHHVTDCKCWCHKTKVYS